MSDKVLVRKQNETPPPDAFINPENAGTGNTVGMSGGGQGAFLNVDPKRPDLSDKNRYSNAQRYGGAALRAGLGALSGVSALSRFSGSDEDAVSAAGTLAQDAYTTYGTTAGAERAIIGRGKEPEKPKEGAAKLNLPSAPDVAVLDAQNNTNTELMAQKLMEMEKKPFLSSSTVEGIDNLLNQPPMQVSAPTSITPKTEDLVEVVTPERVKFTGEKITDEEDGKYGYGKNDPNIQRIHGF